MTEGARGLASVCFCTVAAEAYAAGTGAGAGVLILEPRDADGAPTEPLVAALRRDRPFLVVIAYCDPLRDAAADIRALARAGVNSLLLRGHDDVGAALHRALSAAASLGPSWRVMQELDAFLPSAVRPIIGYCVLNAREPLTVPTVARALGVHQKTLFNRLAAAGMPKPHAIIGWSRLLAVAHVLENPDCTVERVALDLEFPSATAFRNMLRRYTGLRPREMRENGGLPCVLHLFKRALSAGAGRAGGDE